MRTRAGWLALVITGGLALAPAIGRAQPGTGDLDIGGRAAQPVVPLPIYHDRPESGGFYTFLEFCMFRQTRDLGSQLVAQRGFRDVDGSVQAGLGGAFGIDANGNVFFLQGAPGVPGAFIGSGRPALLVSDLNSGPLTYAPGMVLGLGWRFADGSALEWRWKQVVSSRYNAGANIIPPNFQVGPVLADTFLFTNVFNFPSQYAGEAQELALGNLGATYGIWNAAASETIEFMQRYQQQDLTYRIPVRQDDVSRTNITVGERFAWIWERFQWRTISQDFLGRSGPQDVAIFNNIVSNRMYGPTLGCEHELYLGRGFAVTVHVDTTGYLDVVKERADFELANRSTENKKQVIEYTFVPSFNGEIHITWYPVEGIQLRMGWNSVMFLNTVESHDPMPYSTDGTGINFGNINGNWTRKALRYFDGIDVGLAITF